MRRLIDWEQNLHSKCTACREKQGRNQRHRKPESKCYTNTNSMRQLQRTERLAIITALGNISWNKKSRKSANQRLSACSLQQPERKAISEPGIDSRSAGKSRNQKLSFEFFSIFWSSSCSTLPQHESASHRVLKLDCCIIVEIPLEITKFGSCWNPAFHRDSGPTRLRKVPGDAVSAVSFVIRQEDSRENTADLWV